MRKRDEESQARRARLKEAERIILAERVEAEREKALAQAAKKAGRK